MSVVLPLRPEKARITTYSPNGPEECYVDHGFGYSGILREQMERLILADKYDPNETCEALCKAVQENEKEALRHAIRYERNYRKKYKNFPPRTAELIDLQEIGPDGDDTTLDAQLDQLTIPPSFISALNKRIREVLSVFERLGYIRDRLGPEKLRLFQEVEEKLKNVEKNGIDEIFTAIESMRDNPAMVIPHASCEDLYILAFLPRGVRYVIQELFINLCDIDYLRSIKPVDEDMRHWIDDLIEYKRNQIVLNGHWARLLEQYGGSEAIVERMAEYRSRETELLNQMQEAYRKVLQGQDAPLGILKAFKLHHERFDDFVKRMYALEEKMGYKTIFQNTDVGHCFNNRDYQLDEIQKDDGNDRFAYGIDAKKCGQEAMILEDDERQRQRWAGTVQKYSPFHLREDGKSSCARLEEAEMFLDDENIGFYLLDIQIGEDDMAGINYAKRLLEKVVKRLGALDKGIHSEKKEVRIVLWSASHRAVQLATKELQDHIVRLKAERLVEFGSFGNTKPILLKFKMKSSRPWADLV